mgnify:CR=1 FL=1
MKLSFRATLITRMAVLLLLTLAVVGIFSYYQARQAVDDLSTRIVRQTSTLVDERLVTLLRKAESQGKLLTGLITPGMNSGTSRPLNANSLDMVAADMLAIVKANAEFGSVSLTLDRTGEYAQVTQLANSAVSIQTSVLVGKNERVRKDYVPFGDSLRETYQVRNWAYDPRIEAHYQRCKTELRQIWTPAYVFRNFAEEGTPGVTCATPVVLSDGTFIGVLTIDFSLADLSRFLQGITVGQSGYAFLIEQTDTGQAKVIAHPEPDRLLVSDQGRRRLVSLEEFGEPAVTEMLERQPNLGAGGPTQMEEISFLLGGTRYLGGFRPVNYVQGPRWVTCVLVPSSDFVGSTRQAVIFILTLAALSLLVGATIAVVLAQRVARPLQELVTETERIQSLDLGPRPLPESSIHEIDDLSFAMERMKTGLRSFEKLVPAEYARWLLSSGQEARLGGERRNLTTYFADIIGFTSLSNHLPPEELFEVLTEYLDVLSDVVVKNGGTIDKFNGDDVMAFWGAPTASTDHAASACRSALASRTMLERLHVEWKSQDHPLLRAAFGISTGEVVVGNVGSRQRMNYTVIGDSVNLASRLQGMNKYYGTEIMISERTREEAGDLIVSRLVDLVYVLGREEATVAYELIAMAEEATPDQLELVTRHEAGMRAYLAREWADAIRHFESVQELVPDDGPSRVLLERIRELQKNPPGQDWDGTHHMRLK